MSGRFDYVRYDSESEANRTDLQAIFERAETTVTRLVDSRARSVALSKLEEAFMWSGKAIAADQEHRKQAEDDVPF